MKTLNWDRFTANKTARVATIAIATIGVVLYVWAVTAQARTCCGGIVIGSITYVGRATQVKDGQLYQYTVELKDSLIDLAITNGGRQLNVFKDVRFDTIVALDQVATINVSQNGSAEVGVLVSPICDDLKVQAPGIFPNAQWKCAERTDEFGNVIFLPPPANSIPDEAILLKETQATVTQQQCQDNNRDQVCDLDANNAIIFVGEPFTERLICTLPAGFNFDGLFVVRGDDNIERIFCPNCPTPDAPVAMDCRKAT